MTNRSIRIVTNTAANFGQKRERPASNVALFVPIRPQEYVDRVAGIFLEYEHAKAEQLLAMEMAVIADKLLAIGADHVLVAREIRKLENAIRTAMWHQVMGTKP